MGFLRRHWFDVGAGLAVAAAAWLAATWRGIPALQKILWISLMRCFFTSPGPPDRAGSRSEGAAAPTLQRRALHPG